jgi:DNA-binding GntR family transcriptional regulator
LRLAESKAVLMQPNRGAFVAQPTPKEVSDVFVARRVLEAIAEGHTAQALELMELHLSSIEEWLQFTSFQREAVDILEVFAD